MTKVKMFRFSLKKCPNWLVEEEINEFTKDKNIVSIQQCLVKDCHTDLWGNVPEALVFTIVYQE